MRVLFAVLRVAVAGLIVAAIVGQLGTSLAFWRARGVRRLDVTVTNFFSFFTIESNVLAALVLLIGAVLLVARRGSDPGWYLTARVAATTYMVTTGVVYDLLLRSIELPQGTTLAWSNEVLHAVAPAYLLLDWVLAPGRRALGWRALGGIAVFPVVWLAYTLLRGPLVTDELRHRATWYPYPFLDPAGSPLGYWSVALYGIAIAVLIVGAGALAVLLSRRVPRFEALPPVV